MYPTGTHFCRKNTNGHSYFSRSNTLICIREQILENVNTFTLLHNYQYSQDNTLCVK